MLKILKNGFIDQIIHNSNEYLMSQQKRADDFNEWRTGQRMTLAEMIFDGLVWLIGGLVVVYMLRRYWAMFRASQKPASGCSDSNAGSGSCSSCPSKKDSSQ